MKLAFICTEKLPAPAVRGGAIQMMIDGVTPYFSSRYDLTIFSIEDPALPKEKQKTAYIISICQKNITARR
ncbi:Putative glycosyltransferase YtcC [Bacillus subtilis]|nr:Putative glycosyltransferase YtcC [Bacillus subtilis]